MRFTMKPGVSDAITVVLPQESMRARTFFVVASDVCFPGTISTRGRTVGGLKKWTPITRCGRAQTLAIADTERDEVLVPRIQLADTLSSSSRKRRRFASM